MNTRHECECGRWYPPETSPVVIKAALKLEGYKSLGEAVAVVTKKDIEEVLKKHVDSNLSSEAARVMIAEDLLNL